MAFNLGDALKAVSGSGADREQIEYLPLENIEEDPNNFYQMNGIDELAANIQLCGLQQPIRVRSIPNTNRYMIVSGHRRRKAVAMLAEEDPERWQDVPCIVEIDEVSPALQQLRLIYANANTRSMTPAETSEQAAQVEKLLYQLKEEGYEFPGRMRDHVAEAVGASKSKLARLKVIRDNLSCEWKQPWKNNKIGESVAYALAQLPGYWQQLIFSGCDNPSYLYEGTVKEYARRFKEIEKTACGSKKDITCFHKTVMMEKSCNDRWSDPCKSRCCLECPTLRTCKSSCAKAEGRKKSLKDSHKAEADAEAKRIADQNRPKVQLIDSLWQRFGLARELAGKDWSACKKAMDCTYFPIDDDKVMRLECGEAKVTPDTHLPYGIQRYNVERLLALADLLGCSLDFLFCRTDSSELAPMEVPEPDAVWKTGNPEAYGTYVAYVKVHETAKPMLRELLWDGEEWFLFGSKISEDATVQYWADRPGI